MTLLTNNILILKNDNVQQPKVVEISSYQKRLQRIVTNRRKKIRIIEALVVKATQRKHEL